MSDTLITKPPVLDETFSAAMDNVIAELKRGNDLKSLDLPAAFDGSKATYDKIMRKWFLANGVNALTSKGITELCNKWYTITRDGWDGYTSFAMPDVSSVSTGVRGGDNADLSCTPSTDTAANTDDYAGLPLFACVDVNYIVDSDSLDIVITAIKGITGNFIASDPDTFVGVMQMSGYHYTYDTGTAYVHGYADHEVSAGECAPLPEAVRVDGTVRPFVVHSKYMNHTVNGKMTSCAGVIPTAYTISHNSLHALAIATGAQYSGGTTADVAFLILMVYIKYASLTLDGIMQGCCNYSNQYYAQVSETSVKRVIVPADTIIEEGSSVLIGVYNGSSTDRQTATNYSISTNAGLIVTSVENITIDGTGYKAVYVDAEEAFDTVANGNGTSGSTIISTFHWRNGATDRVLGNDGSPVSNTDGKHPFKCQGIEYMVGGYEVLADVIMNVAENDGISYYTPHIVRRSANQASSITANYEALDDLAIICPETDSWGYIKKLGFFNGVFYPQSVGGSSTSFTRDAFYQNKQGTTGAREWLSFGALIGGAALAGLSYLGGNFSLGLAFWHCLARLSPNGNRGEWAA